MEIYTDFLKTRKSFIGEALTFIAGNKHCATDITNNSSPSVNHFFAVANSLAS